MDVGSASTRPLTAVAAAAALVVAAAATVVVVVATEVEAEVMEVAKAVRTNVTIDHAVANSGHRLWRWRSRYALMTYRISEYFWLTSQKATAAVKAAARPGVLLKAAMLHEVVTEVSRAARADTADKTRAVSSTRLPSRCLHHSLRSLFQYFRQTPTRVAVGNMWR